MKKKMPVLIMTIFLFGGYSHAKENNISSPNGKLNVNIYDEDQKPTYEIIYNGKIFLEKSPLGLLTNIGDFTSDLTLSDDIKKSTITDSYELNNIKQRKISYEANEGIFSFVSKNGSPAIDILFRVSDNDIAFKYLIHKQGDALSCIIHEEVTGFMLPTGTTTFLCPQSGPMGGFARTSPSYETPYTADAPTGQNGWGLGYTFPCLFKENENGWLLISETGVDSRYCGSRLIGHPEGLYTIGYPQAEENNGNGTLQPGIKLPGETPWRTITVGETLAPIVETTIPFDVVKPAYEASFDYNTGKGTWSWIIGMDESVNYDDQIRYIDFSSALGYEYVLVDNWWDKQIGRDKIEELARYAAEKNVGLFLWYNSNGYWNDAPQTPRQYMNNGKIRREEMKWLQSIGIKGIKVDFFGGDKQITMQLYEEILSDANDYGLMVVFHGCTLPRGWERMFPNFATAEAVLASENMYFSQESCDNEAFNASLHPFIRNTVGSMDFGGSTLNKYYNSLNCPEKNGSKRMTSDVFALATSMLFQSGIQFFSMAPNNLNDAPEWAVDFMKNVPTTWDETRFIDGYPGKYIVLARRNKDKWYIGAINAQNEAIKLNLNLPMLSSDEKITLYTDDLNLQGKVSSHKLNKNKQIKLTIPKNGASVIVN